ncbi:MAG: M15 family metallopeptidase [Magnetococcus sp. WYHC-3]
MARLPGKSAWPFTLLSIPNNPMTTKQAYDANLLKIAKLAPNVQWAVRQLMEDSWAQGIYWCINSGLRTYAEQLYLYALGRWKGGRKVTWTLDSDHLRGLAIDLTMIKGTYENVDDVGRIYRIHRDPKLIALGDLGHYTLTDSVCEPEATDIDPMQRRKLLKRRLERETDGDRRAVIERVLKRLEERMKEDGLL